MHSGDCSERVRHPDLGGIGLIPIQSSHRFIFSDNLLAFLDLWVVTLGSWRFLGRSFDSPRSRKRVRMSEPANEWGKVMRRGGRCWLAAFAGTFSAHSPALKGLSALPARGPRSPPDMNRRSHPFDLRGGSRAAQAVAAPVRISMSSGRRTFGGHRHASRTILRASRAICAVFASIWGVVGRGGAWSRGCNCSCKLGAGGA